jgi:hypothetical protein
MEGSVDVRDDPKLGRSLFAKSIFKPGDVVLREQPLLVTAPDSHPAVKALHSAAVQAARTHERASGQLQTPSDDWLKAAAWTVAFLEAPLPVQQAVVSDMHTAIQSDSQMAATAQLQADILLELVSAVLARLRPSSVSGAGTVPSKEGIHKALLAYHLNAHEMHGLG